jgi:hypothetical protein
MWNFTEKDKQQVETIYNHFLPLFSNLEPKALYDRILSGYCYGENGIWLKTIEDWEKVLMKDPTHFISL